VDERIKKLEQKVDKLEAGPPAPTSTEIDWDQVGNMVFFRGGGAWLTSNRSNEVFTDVFLNLD
jgi:hypothetical protein